MKTILKIILVLAVVVAVGAGVFYYLLGNDSEGSRVFPGFGQGQNDVMEKKLAAASFTGKLEEVNTGCFADAECYVVVDGKHVTTTMGWSQEIVGAVLGVEGFGDLENHIGKLVRVYAQDKGDGTYTLYGSESFYVKLME
jgi:hypothetical protein